jgi:hypothetical protein
MTSLELKLFSLRQSKVMKIESAQDIDHIIVELLSNFSYQVDDENHRVSVDALQQNTPQLRENIAFFIEQTKGVAPQINQLSTFINNLADGEYFYIFPNSDLETIQIAELGNHLQALNHNLDIHIAQEEFTAIFGQLLANYDMISFNGESRIHIGEREKSKKICRFCGKGEPNVSFRKKAHAISEALGNKGIVCNEECDDCNSRFGDGIETDLIAFLSLYRAFFGIKGKGGGTPKLKGKNFSLKKSEEGEVNFQIISDDSDSGLPERIEAHTNDKVSQQNIYRALCKYVLSVIPNEYLVSLDQCLHWVNQETPLNEFAPIYMRVVNDLYSEYPSLSVFIRKNSDPELPYIVGDFRFANIVIVFVVPSDKDTKPFATESDSDKFWSISHYSRHAPRDSWKKMILSSDEKHELSFIINFEKRV